MRNVVKPDKDPDSNVNAEELLPQLDMLISQLKQIMSPDELEERLSSYHGNLNVRNSATQTIENLNHHFEFAPVCLLRLSHKGRIESISQSCQHLLGSDAQNVLGKPFASWILPSDISEYFQHIKQAMETQNKQVDYFRIIGPDNKLSIVRMETMVELNRNNGSSECRILMMDVTELKKQESELFESSRRLNKIVQATPDVIFYLDNSLTIEFINHSRPEWFARESVELLKKNLALLIGEEKYNNILNHPDLHNFDFVFNDELVLVNDQGIPKRFLLCLAADYDVEYQIRGYSGYLRNVNHPMSLDGKERKHLLESAQIARLSNMGEMASGIAHELNQPLTSISVYCELLIRTLDNKAIDRQMLTLLLQKISEQSMRAGAITRRLKRFAGKKSLYKSFHNINTLIDNAVQLVNVEVQRHHVEIHMLLGDGLPKVRVNGLLIEQVIVNLLRNAVEALSEVPRELRRVLIKTDMMNDNKLILEVSDSGTGFPTNINKIFETFYTTKLHGLGMGLAICKSIIEDHKSQIVARNNEEGGATIRIVFPVTRLKTV